MRDFMGDHEAQCVRRRQDQAPAEAYRAARGATAPAADRIADRHGCDADSCHRRHPRSLGAERVQRLPPQPALDAAAETLEWSADDQPAGLVPDTTPCSGQPLEPKLLSAKRNERVGSEGHGRGRSGKLSLNPLMLLARPAKRRLRGGSRGHRQSNQSSVMIDPQPHPAGICDPPHHHGQRQAWNVKVRGRQDGTRGRRHPLR